MINSQKWQPQMLKIGGLALAVVVAGAVGAVGLAQIWLSPPSDDLNKLFIYLLTSGGLSVGLVLLGLAFQSAAG